MGTLENKTPSCMTFLALCKFCWRWFNKTLWSILFHWNSSDRGSYGDWARKLRDLTFLTALQPIVIGAFCDWTSPSGKSATPNASITINCRELKQVVSYNNSLSDEFRRNKIANAVLLNQTKILKSEFPGTNSYTVGRIVSLCSNPVVYFPAYQQSKRGQNLLCHHFFETINK